MAPGSPSPAPQARGEHSSVFFFAHTGVERRGNFHNCFDFY